MTTTVSQAMQTINSLLSELNHTEMIRLHSDLEDLLIEQQLFTVHKNGQPCSTERLSMWEATKQAEALNDEFSPEDRCYHPQPVCWMDGGPITESERMLLQGF